MGRVLFVATTFSGGFFYLIALRNTFFSINILLRSVRQVVGVAEECSPLPGVACGT